MPVFFAAPGPVELMILLLIVGIMLPAAVLPFWMICIKAGFPGWYSLAVLIPILQLVLMFFLAFAEWPALRQHEGPQQDQD